MTWYRKLLDALKTINSKYNKFYNIKEPEPEETLEQWKERLKNNFLKIRDNKTVENPYVTYFFNYCVYCNKFCHSHSGCFNVNGQIYVERVLKCSKLRLNNKLLQKK